MNPFSTCVIRPDNNKYRFHSVRSIDQEHQEAFLKRLFDTLQTPRLALIIGPHGTGKTTLLRGLEPMLRQRFTRVSWTTLSTDKRSNWREIWECRHDEDEYHRGAICYVVDGFEQLSWWDRLLLIWRVKRATSRCLLVTSHRPLWPIPICHQTYGNVEMTRILAAEKLAEIAEPIRTELWSKLESQLLSGEEGATNVRDLWFAMYDEFEKIHHQEQLKS